MNRVIASEKPPLNLKNLLATLKCQKQCGISPKGTLLKCVRPMSALRMPSKAPCLLIADKRSPAVPSTVTLSER